MKLGMKFALFLVIIFFNFNFAQLNNGDSLEYKIKRLEDRLNRLESAKDENELEKILRQAESEANIEKKVEKTKIFRTGQRSLQAINPEISLTADAWGQGILNENGFSEAARSGAFFRVAGLHFQSNLDPFSLAKAAIEIHPDRIELGEAYAIWTNLFDNVSLMAGKFRQQFGVVNRWHAHGLDQFEFPLAMTTILGGEGLNQIGVSFEWLMPAITSPNNLLTLQLTNGQNDHLFAGETFSSPSLLGHFKNYYDLSQNTYFEIGLTGMIGRNNQRGYDDKGNLIDESKRMTYVGGVDLTLMWEPVAQALYHSFVWRTEFYFVNKEQLNSGSITAWGAYTYGQYQFNEWFFGGLRFDYTQPFEANNAEKYTYQIVPYITWWQSHWVRLRLQYNYLAGTDLSDAQNTLRLQLTWAIGPHKHERY